MSHVIQLFVLTVFLCLCLQDSGVDSFFWIFTRHRNRAPHRRPHRQPHRPIRRVIPQPTNGPLYRGCYRTGNLPGMIRVPVGANRPPVCIQTCKQKRYSFAGLQRDICYCMEQLDKTKRASEGSCGIRCRGATYRKCGHNHFMSVYGTGLNGVCECSASGDPHYYTFNRQAIHFQGICTYTLTKSTKPNDRCAFNVEVKNERRGGNTRVSYTKNIYITAHGDTIQFRKEKVYVNGIQRYLPYEKGNVYEIYKTGNNIRYQSNCLFHVEWNMVHAVTVNVPVSYRNKLTGICGKCNILRKRDDYMTKGGRNVINERNRYVLIGDSYAVNDPDRRCKTVKPPGMCTPALKAVATSRKGCGNMNPQNKANNPFRKCLERFRTLAKERFDSCVFDYCSTTQTHLRQKLICEALGDFAELCVRRGVKISAWRTPTFCPFKCKKNEVYKTSTTGCPTSCLKPTRKSKCSAPNSEGCECKPGYTLSGIHCVPNWKCGCKKNGLYYPIGSKVITCNEFISCERIGGKAKLHTTPRINSCPKFSKCTGYIQKDKCECIRDYEMKGNLCLPIRPKLCRCVASGDPHYYTYDEQVIHFQGICKYTLTKSLKQNDKCGFNVEVKNQNRGWNKKVSYTKDIYVTVNGDTISFIGNKIYINKFRVYLPFTGTSYKMARRPNGAVHFHVPDCHIYVIWNPKAASVTVSVPKTYANQMTGICGNCNGRKDDFKTKGGKDVSGKTNKYTLIGDSYLVKDVNGKGKCPSTEPPNMCTTRLNRLAKEKQNCGYLSFVYGHQNPFRKCIENNKNMAKIMYDSCVFDFCAYEKSNTLLREIMCKTLASFAELCEETGYLVNWRKPNFCPLKCGRNMVYSNSITACPASCADPFSRKTCKYPDTIGCKCKHGYMLSGDKCVKKCGCKNNGRYYPDGTILRSKDCLTKSSCSKGSFNSKRVKCQKNSKCVLTNGGYDCKCNKRYIKNGDECRLKRTECNTKADIVFLLDASGSVKKSNFRKMLTFVKDFTHKFNIGRNDMQIGINTFATTTKKAFNLKRYRNKADLIHAIGNVHYTRGWTFTGKALKYTRVNSFARTAGHRLGVPKIAIVMTDGKSTNTSSTETEAEKAHADGIKVFAVGIGNGPDNKELKKIASNPKSRRVIHIDNFILLTTIVGQLSTRACEAANNGEVTLCEGKKTSISCSRNEFIYIKSATYGRTNRKSCATRASGMRDTNCRASNTAAVVQKKCQGEKWCTLHAINSLFGDPCAGTRKYLHVRYTCKPDKKIRVIVCEGRKRRIRCPREKVISIVKAVYGRSNKWTCRRSSNQMKNTNCFARDSRSIVRKMCNGKPRCDLSAKNSVFKDPCYGTFKYLTVHFVCKRPRRRKLICEGQKSTISCRRNHVIYIKSAMYGRTNRNYCLRKPPHRVAFLSIRYPTLCIALKSRAIASKICNARHRCVLNASSRIFGDPCPRTRKYLSVQFKCIPFVRKPPVIVCERRRRTISCGVGLAIYITSAVYGRSSTMICRNRYLRVRNTKCAASGSLAIMQSKCNRKRSCRLQASNKVFGDPCLGTYKYLSVRYKCMPRYVIPVVPKSPPTPTTPPRPPTPPTPLSVCMLPHSKRGMCRGRRSMWSYNARTGKCVSFFYGGCGGNANRFGTEIECANKCKYKDCYKKRKDYQGRVSYTISGYKCQKWSSNFPHKHKYCFRSLPENYCRSPDSSSRPWCYTTDPKKRWEYCDVQKCGSVRRMDSVCNAKHSYNPPLCLGATRWGVSGTLMWSYNSQTGRCVPFNVRCGGGNKNKFKRRAQCSRRCLAKDCYHDAKGKNYKGFQSYTQSGYKCQHWILNYPHKHIFRFNNLPENYCRNPDSSKRPWCYTTNPKVRWEYCNVKRCSSRRSGKCKITRIVNKRMNRIKYIVVGTCKFVSVRRNGCPYKVNLYRKGSRNIAVVKLPNQRPYVLRSGIYTRRRKYGCVSIRLYNKALVLHQRIP